MVGKFTPKLARPWCFAWLTDCLAPLYDANGKLTFYIGGQINCSTTIRSNTDVLRILSMSDDPEDDKEAAQSIRNEKTSKRSFLGFSRKDTSAQLPQSTKKVEIREAGMEQGLLKQIGKVNFRTQMEMFYTAYSKVTPFSHLARLDRAEAFVVPRY